MNFYTILESILPVYRVFKDKKQQGSLEDFSQGGWQDILGTKNIENWNKRANFLFAREARAKFLPRESFMIVGKQVKDCWGKKMRGWGKLIKEEMVFPYVIFSPSHIQTKKSSSLFSLSSFSFPFFPFFSFPLFPSVSVFIFFPRHHPPPWP